MSTTPENESSAEAVDPEAKAAQDEVTEAAFEGAGDLLKQIEALQGESNTHKERYLRSVADLENFRKRASREKEEIRRTAALAVIEDLLPALDNMQMGLASADQHPEAKEIAKGFEMVSTQIEQVLKSHGLEPIAPKQGDAFDPNEHEGVAFEPNDAVEDHHIISVMRTGYKLNERLLRPASVVVSSGKLDAKA